MRSIRRKSVMLASLLTITLIITGCNPNEDATINETDPTTETPFTITHDGTTYGIVTSPYTGKVWLDKNLGATQVCTALDDVACYGDYYQFGRNFDGHQESNSTVVTVLATDVNNAGSNFISGISGDWVATGVDDNGSLRESNWIKADGTSVCPSGYRLPTLDELSLETINSADGMTNQVDAFTNFLKLPAAGSKSSQDGLMQSEGVDTDVWTSTPNASFTRNFTLYISDLQAASAERDRANAYSVRCIEN